MKKSQRIYDRDFKEMAVLLSHEGSTIEKIEQELNITKTLLNRWRQDFYKYGKGSFPGCGNLRLSPEDNKIYLLKKRIEKAELHSSIISNAVPYLSMGLISIYHFIERFEKKCSAKQICKILSVDQRSYSRWKNRHYIHERKKRKIELQQIITALFNENKKRYGYMRISAELQKRGYKISSSTTARYMRELGLCVSIKKP